MQELAAKSSVLTTVRYHTTLGYPLLDSFPDIFSLGFKNSIGVDTSLTTSTQISSRIRDLQKAVNRMVSLDEREALSNRLGEINEGYEEGWESGSGDDSDD